VVDKINFAAGRCPVWTNEGPPMKPLLGERLYSGPPTTSTLIAEAKMNQVTVSELPIHDCDQD
jgi:hypothetical protein